VEADPLKSGKKSDIWKGRFRKKNIKEIEEFVLQLEIYLASTEKCIRSQALASQKIRGIGDIDRQLNLPLECQALSDIGHRWQTLLLTGKK
jgi:hypothetical protein